MAAYPVAAGRCFCRSSIGRRVSRRTASLRTTPARRWVNNIRQLSATGSQSTAWLSRSSPGRMQPDVKNSRRLFSDRWGPGIVRQTSGRLHFGRDWLPVFRPAAEISSSPAARRQARPLRGNNSGCFDRLLIEVHSPELSAFKNNIVVENSLPRLHGGDFDPAEGTDSGSSS